MPQLLVGNIAAQFESPSGGDIGLGAPAQEIRPDMYDGHMDWDGGGWWVMMGMMFVFWIGVLAIAAWAVATYARRDQTARQDSALDIAKRRYARGEITSEEFEQIQRHLQ